MKSLLTISAAMILVAAGNATGPARSSHVKGTGFTIDFPSTPQVSKEVRTSSTAGRLFITRYSLAIPGHAVYYVQNFNAESGFPANNSHGEGLGIMMQQAAQSAGAQVVSSSRLDWQGCPGLVVMMQKGNEVGRAFAVQSPNHIFVVMAISNPSEINSPVLSGFLNSFKVAR